MLDITSHLREVPISVCSPDKHLSQVLFPHDYFPLTKKGQSTEHSKRYLFHFCKHQYQQLASCKGRYAPNILAGQGFFLEGTGEHISTPHTEQTHWGSKEKAMKAGRPGEHTGWLT